MATEILSPSPRQSLLEKAIVLPQFHWEFIGYVVIIVLSLLAHFWGLSTMAMHHDESIHAWASWNFYTGRGGFTCANGGSSATYCYDPVYHGPVLYFLTFFSYFLFNDGDWQARLPMALAGSTMVASCWMLRPYLGRRGALLAAVLVGFSPSLLYFTRFARHDGLMVLWEIWLLIGFFRYLETGKAAYLYLLATSIALAIGTHELYYILFFIFGTFIGLRILAESRFTHYLDFALLIILALLGILMLWNPLLPIGKGLYLGEKAFLVGFILAAGWLAQRALSNQHFFWQRLTDLWQNQRLTLWVAIGILGSLYLVLYTTFFAYPRGAIDGLYAGLFYWLGSQHDYARGDQPWYYYLMQLGIYEPLSIACSFGATIYLVRRYMRQKSEINQKNAEINESKMQAAASDQPKRKTRFLKAISRGRSNQAFQTLSSHELATETFPLFLVFWFFSAFVAFSWAGEKMPWLVAHIALPGNLLAAWFLEQLLRITQEKLKSSETSLENSANPKDTFQSWAWLLVPPTIITLIIILFVSFWRLSANTSGQAAQTNLLQGLIPLLLVGGLVYALLSLGKVLGQKRLLAVTALTLLTICGAYMLRATSLVVYEHPDTPIEPLVYTQTSPDVPRFVEAIRILAINQTRNHRTADDVAGGLSMPIAIDSGGKDGDGSLAWPLQWYLRNFQKVLWKNGSTFTAKDLETQLPDGSNGSVPVVMLYKPHVTDEVRAFLQDKYVQPYGETNIFNWWFPEGDKCSPDKPGYKQFYFNAWTAKERVAAEAPKGCGAAAKTTQFSAPWAPVIWPFQPQNWEILRKYLLYRDLPGDLTPGAREMEVWVRKDLVSSFGEQGPSKAGSSFLQLVAQQALGSPDQLNNPTGLVVDNQGLLYVADTQNNRIQVFDPSGKLVRTFGSLGRGEGQFNEPRALALDPANNLYVADTWNARIVKMTREGQWLKTWGTGEKEIQSGRWATITEGTAEANAANPLGLFGPRSVAVDAKGRVYIADTGNRRIVVTDGDGNFLYQWGSNGSAAGQFNEPVAVALDATGKVYVADIWNSRVQVFEPGADGNVAPVPTVTWQVSGWKPNSYEDPSLGVSPTGQVYVSVPSQQQVLAFTPRGELSLRWGSAGKDLASFNWPSGIAVGNEGSILVVDRGNARVLRFRLPEVKPNS